MRLRAALVPLCAAPVLLTAACSGSSDAAGTSSAAPTYGKCQVTGTRGEFKLKTIIPDTVTVKADLPSQGWYNGDTVEAIDSGFDYCLLATVAYRSGVDKVKLVNTSFDGLVAGKAGSFDMSLNQITITDERKAVMDFSTPYFDSTAGLLVKKDADVTAANLATKKIGVKQGTVGQLLAAEKIKPAKEVAVFPGDPELQAAVAAGRVDVGVQDLSILLAAAKASGGKLAVAGQIATGEQYGVMLPKGSPNTATVDKIVAQAKEDGTLTRLAKTYLTEAYGVDPTTVPVWTLS